MLTAPTTRPRDSAAGGAAVAGPANEVTLGTSTTELEEARVSKVRLMFSLGFALLSLADILFAYLSGLGAAHLDPIVDAFYIAAYGFLARGAVCQHHLVSI